MSFQPNLFHSLMAGAFLTVFPACSHFGHQFAPIAKGSSEFQVNALAAVGQRFVSERYLLQLSRRGRDAVEVKTVRPSGEIEAAGLSIQYDSAAPKPSDPWPLSIQTAIGRVPVVLHLDVDGQPTHIASTLEWRELAWESIQAMGVPASAKNAAEALLQPDSVVANFARDVPGLPIEGKPWLRTVQLAGLKVALTQDCTREKGPRIWHWTCAGTSGSATHARGQIFDLNTVTEITTDRLGLIEHTMVYDGILIRADSNGALSLHAIAGKRSVKRQPVVSPTPTVQPGNPRTGRQ
jgi:hypothetical protein